MIRRCDGVVVRGLARAAPASWKRQREIQDLFRNLVLKRRREPLSLAKITRGQRNRSLNLLETPKYFQMFDRESLLEEMLNEHE